jgi:hypothetical protein
MKTQEALKLVGGLSKPSKMPGWAYGIPAKECKTGKKLQNVEGSTCYGCYALKGCYVFKVVQDAQYRRLGSIRHPYWVRAMTHLLQSKKSKYFRWHDSGDVQDLKHLAKIFEVARRTPDVRHWMPTREAWVKHFCQSVLDNLIIRFSAPMVDQAAPASWPNTSTVESTWKHASNSHTAANVPSPRSRTMLAEDCRACWDPNVKNVAYGQH